MSPGSPSEETIFARAFELAPAERAAFLAQACAADAALRARVESLLRAHDAAEQEFLTAPAADLPRVPPPEVGTRIGRYKLLQKIGEGGCGVVYMAEQEEPVRRRVALKVIKLGMDTKEVIARFEAERQALALMDHANIARVFDAGTTEPGRPFFVMELVRGVPITRFCDEQNLSTRVRLDLFIQVCHAVQHAHQKGIIHRDLKPSNILVTLHDGVAVPKVIDFGIAKATQGRLTDSTLFTAFEQFIGTPAYMSPEQAELSGLDIDTRSDIYSLGVLLYELLTGRPPFDPKTLIAAGFDEIRRIIREVDPPRPSTRLGTLSDLDRATIAKQRGILPAQLCTLLRGDLDWIVMRCLEKDRSRRYETANGLALDVLRHLDSQPIAARPASTAYRFRKAIARNKLMFGAAAAVGASLMLGIAISTLLALQARRAERVALAERSIAITERNRAVAARLEAEALRNEALGASARDRRTAPQAGPLKLAALRRLVQLNLETQNLARAASWQRSLDEETLLQADEARYWAATFDNGVHSTLTALRARAGTLLQEKRAAEEIPVRQEIVDILRERLGPSHVATLVALHELSRAYHDAGQDKEALPLATEAHTLRATRIGPDYAPTLQTLELIAQIHRGAWRPADAVLAQQEVASRNAQRWGVDDEKTLNARDTLVKLLLENDAIDQAETIARDIWQIRRRKDGPDIITTAGAAETLGLALLRARRFREAETILRESLAIRERDIPDDWRTFNTLNYLGAALAGQSKHREAEPLLTSGYEGLKKREPFMAADSHSQLAAALEHILNFYRNTSQPALLAKWQDEVDYIRARRPPIPK